ncbi:hypothetical protein D3C72_840530 [compost metagenome]
MQDFSDFAVGQAFDIGQIHCFALGFRQRVDAANHLRGHHMRLCGVLTIERQLTIGIDLPRPLTHATSAYFIEPDRMQNAQQPAIHARTVEVLTGALQRSHTRGLHQILGQMPIARQQQTVAPQSRQMLSEFCSECLIVDDDGGPYKCSGFR